jgi:glycosyltransferase involved in cell wall biosynthesis
MVRGGWRLIPGVRAFATHTALILAGNRETAALADRLGARNVRMMLDVGLPDDFLPEMPSTPRDPRSVLQLLWVGRVLPRKALDLALDVLEACAEIEVHLTVVGDDYPDQPVIDRERVRRLGSKVTCTGTLSWSEVAEAYRHADVFLFTSLRDSCGVQLLEAMAFGLPIVTLDHQGAALLVPDDAGIRVRVCDPSETVARMAAAVRRLAQDPDLAAAMGKAAHAAARRHTWDQKVLSMLDHYAEVIEARPSATLHRDRTLE